MSRIGIIGAGAWGTSLASVLQRAGNDIVLQAHESETVDSINVDHVNGPFLPGVLLDPKIYSTTKLDEATNTDAVLLVTPAQHLRAVCEKAAPGWSDDVPAIICTKGIEQNSYALMSEVVAATLPRKPMAILSGPTFAIEVARDMPTAVALASNDEALGKILMEYMNSRHFRIYRSGDVVGAQIGGAVKNVIAIACGIVEGRGLGENARSALVTRGLAEMIRLGVAKGARPETLSGLSGLGDLTLTCYSMKSRNFSLGVAIGRGEALDKILDKRKSVAEGVYSASSVTGLARELGIEVPICDAVNDVINNAGDIDTSISELLSRPLKEETN